MGRGGRVRNTLSGDWLNGGVDAGAERLAETGVTEGVFDRAEAAAFVEELSGAFRLGWQRQRRLDLRPSASSI